MEKTLAFAYFSRRVLLEGLLEKGFQGRVGGLGWGVDKEVKDFNGDFMYEKGDQMTNWVCIFFDQPFFFFFFFFFVKGKHTLF